LVKMLWRYGMDVIRVQLQIRSMMKKFKRIYKFQAAEYAFSTPEKLLSSMCEDFPADLTLSIAEHLRNKGFSPPFIDEVVMCGMRTNYGQTTSIQAFVGAVSLAGMTPGLWCVQGGNKRIPEELLSQNPSATHVNSKVTKVTLTTDEGAITYNVESCDKSGDVIKKDYDFVVIATPLHDQLSGITFENFPNKIGDYTPRFHRTVTTYVDGEPNASTFNLKSGDFPDTILTCNPDLYFNSMSRRQTVEDTTNKINKSSHIYKVFSQLPLTENILAKLFTRIKDVKVRDWLGAYPHYPASITAPLPPFELHPQLYYLNGIELCSSAMEMSAIAGRNVALIAHHKWKGVSLDKIDSDKLDDVVCNICDDVKESDEKPNGEIKMIYKQI